MKLTTLFSVLAIALAARVANAQQNYLLFDLTAGSHYTQTGAYGINNLGHITGFGVLPKTSEIHAFIFKNGGLQDLGLLGYTASDGIRINDTDQLAIDGIGPGSTALLYANGTANPIGSIDGGYTYVWGMNNLGDIVGVGVNGDGARVGFSYVGGVFTDLSPINILQAAAINESEAIVGGSGYYWTYGGYVHGVMHGFLYANGVFTDLGNLSGDPRTNTEAFGINKAGDIVGYSTGTDGLFHAFLYTNGAMQDLGTFTGKNTVAIGINNSGQILGEQIDSYGILTNGPSFLYQNGTMTDLSTLIVRGGAGWSGLTVTGINDNGAIVGVGNVNNGSQGFLALPAGSTPLATSLAVTPAKGQIGSTVTLTATLKAIAPGLPAAGEPVQFAVAGANVGAPATTNALGQAKLRFAVPEGMTLAIHTLTATFAGDAYYNKSTANGTLSLSKGPVKITVRSVTGQAGATVTLTATLTDNDKAPLSGESLSFSVAGVSVGSASTNASGVTSLPYAIPAGTAAGTYTILVSFGGDATHLSGSKTGTLTVN